jgi:hypothetical protein
VYRDFGALDCSAITVKRQARPFISISGQPSGAAAPRTVNQPAAAATSVGFAVISGVGKSPIGFPVPRFCRLRFVAIVTRPTILRRAIVMTATLETAILFQAGSVR